MNNPKTYGEAPFSIVVVHGGPGAAGEMAPVARELASIRGVLEPYQTELSLEGQIEELKTIIENHGDLPVMLIGYSWGAWLSLILTSRYPVLVKKLILVASGPYEEKYAAEIQSTRLRRLSAEEREQTYALSRIINTLNAKDKNAAFAQLGVLLSQADTYDAIIKEPEEIDYQADIFENVWPQGAQLRKNGSLLKLAAQIECPVLAMHGDYDPHPAEGVEKPLSAVVHNFRFILLKNCGHKPWNEREARDIFFNILSNELNINTRI